MSLREKTSKFRRKLKFRTIQEAVIDARWLAAQPVETVGQWTLAQNLWHLARAIEGSLNRMPGVEAMPGSGRLVPTLTRPFRPLMLRMPLPRGVKIPEAVRAFVTPPADASLPEALGMFEAAAQRAAEPGAMRGVHPLFGDIGHKHWTNFHCRHAELHLGNIVPATAHAPQGVPT